MLKWRAYNLEKWKTGYVDTVMHRLETDFFPLIDNNLQYQQNLKEAPLPVIVLVAADNKIETLDLLKILLRIEGKLDQSLQKLVGRQTGEVFIDELLCKEAADITELPGPVAGGINKIAVRLVDDDHILGLVEARPPKLSGGALKRIAGEPLLDGSTFFRFWKERFRDGNQTRAGSNDIALPHGDLYANQGRL